ncbi:UPF0061 protein OsccyDRAFT_2249 [Striga asiatica]|uniref:UPF0061 protein OsccyDRAFT_2249 n=1 Tax=Striga asiatica TaxID=4170 RepID=A0A5A7PN18_STRAF|nr:UPF0061 protein OsccyDRAFT_2249 [Striga asiatica]
MTRLSTGTLGNKSSGDGVGPVAQRIRAHPVPLPTWHVPLVRKNQQLVKFPGTHERVHEPRRVPEVHVLVDHPVHQQKPSLQIPHVLHNRASLGQAHVFLGVERVVAVPRSDWSTGDRAPENARKTREGHGREVSSVAPTVDPDVGPHG